MELLFYMGLAVLGSSVGVWFLQTVLGVYYE
jgi:hypothetical protein